MNKTDLQPVPLNTRRHDNGIRFSVCTLVTDLLEYGEMVRSMKERGFGGGDCEYLYIDNSRKNAADAYAGYNLFLTEASGTYIILCHQDVFMLMDGRSALERRLAELDALDPAWALCGNAGATETGKLVMRISDPHGKDQALGPFPARVVALDENFIVARRDANLALSHDLKGFHLYGADLCTIADILGRSAYVVDFHLHHKSAGTLDHRFYEARIALMQKYSRALRARWITTTCTSFRVDRSYWRARLLTAARNRLMWLSAARGIDQR